MIRANSPLVLLLSLAGLVPFLACGYLACAYGSASDGRAMLALLVWGAVILSFLGGIQWGWVLAEDGAEDRLIPGASPALTVPVPPRVQKSRLGLSVLPPILGWAALLLGILVPSPALALCLLIAGFIATALGEQAGHRLGLLPRRYLWLRWIMTVLVVALLTTVLVLRLTGARIVF